MKFLLPLALLTGVLGQSGHSSLQDVLSANPKTLSSLSSLLGTQPDLVKALSAAKNITILAPNNDAFGKLTDDAKRLVASNPGFAKALLQYHVISSGAVPASAITVTPTFAPTLLTNQTYTNVTSGQVVNLQEKDNGVTASSAFGATSRVVTADVTFQGGVIHVIDTVLTIPESIAKTAAAAKLNTLASSLTKTNLLSTAESLQNITVFAPRDEAFAAISSTVAKLSNDDLSKILTYHVVPGIVGYSSVLTNTTLPTVNGKKVQITVKGGQVSVDSAKVVLADVLIANGVLHVIDGVLNPNSGSQTAAPSSTAQKPSATSGSATASGRPATPTTAPTSQGSTLQRSGAVLAGLAAAVYLSAVL